MRGADRRADLLVRGLSQRDGGLRRRGLYRGTGGAFVVGEGASGCLIAFDRDEAGERGAAKVADKLEAHGIECSRVQFPTGMDANEYALKVTPPAKSLGVLLPPGGMTLDRGCLRHPLRGVDAAASSVRRRARAFLFSIAAEISCRGSPTGAGQRRARRLRLTEAGGCYRKANGSAPPAANPSAIEVVRTSRGDRAGVGRPRWRVRGLAKNIGFELLERRRSRRSACARALAPRHARSVQRAARERFIACAAAETALKPDLLKRDLGRVLLKLEELQEARLKAGGGGARPRRA